MRFVFVLLLLGLGFIVGCDQNKVEKPQPGQAKTTSIQIGDRRFILEIADTPGLRERGLMYRKTVPADGGMIFIFDEPQVLKFWMRNTVVPLDILFVDEGGQIVSIKQMQPLDETPVGSEEPAKYAIELNAGAAQEVRVKVGDKLSIPK